MDAVALSGMENHLLSAMAGECRAAIDAQGCLVDLNAGELLLRADQPIEHVWFVNRGVVSVSHRLSEAVDVEVGLVGAEGLLGIPLALGVPAAPLLWRVCVPGSAIRLGRGQFLHLLAHDAQLRALVLAYANAFMLQISQSAACAAKHTITQRLARWILMCHAKAGEDDIDITHHALAQALGVRRAGVTGALHVLEGAQAIRSRRGRIILRDAGKLRALACTCATEFSIAPCRTQERPDPEAWRLPHTLGAPANGVIQRIDFARR